MLQWITLALVVAKYALDFIAPRTRTKADDKVKDVLDAVPLPSLPEAAQQAGLPAPAAPNTQTTMVAGFGPARDHRTKA